MGLLKDVFKYFKLDLTVISLIFVNLITLIFAILQKWDIKAIFYIYFFQTIIIWFFTIFKLIFKNNKKCTVKKENRDKLNNLKIEKIKTILSLIIGIPVMFIVFFLILEIKLTSSTIFVFIVLYLLSFIFYLYENKKENLLGLMICYPVIFVTIFYMFKLLFGNPVFNLEIGFIIFLFFINHLLSLVFYLKSKYGGTQHNQTIIKIMTLRIIIIYIMICLLWLLFNIYVAKENLVSNFIAIVLLFIIKTPIDIYYHNKGFYITKKKNKISSKIKKAKK